jgi:hypothetical protein
MKDLTRFVGSRSGRLPTVGDVPPYGIIGVSPSKYLERDPDPPYVRRDIDEHLDDALVEQRFLVVVGPSKAGSPVAPSRRCAGSFRRRRWWCRSAARGRSPSSSATRPSTSTERRTAAGEELIRILTRTASSDPARAALQAMGECLRWELGALWHVDPVAGRLTCAATWRWPLADLRALEESRRRGTLSLGDGLPGRVWQAGQAAWITDLAEEAGLGNGAATSEGTSDEAVHGWFGFPVVAGGEVLGVVEFFSREARQLDSELVQMATRLGRLFGRLLGGAVQEQEVEQEQGSGQEGAAEQDWSLDAAASAPPNADQLLLRELVARVARVNEMLEAIVGPDPTDPETTAPPAVATGERTAAPRSRSGRALTLKVLSELTGVPPGTLRTWERRYGFTHPSRSAAGYRQYGEADVSRVLQIKQLRERGVRIGEAIQVVSESVSDIVPENPPTVGDPAPPPPTEPGPHR